MHDGRINTYRFEKHGKKFKVHPFDDEVDKVKKGTILAYVRGVEQQEHVELWYEGNKDQNLSATTTTISKKQVIICHSQCFK